MTTPAMTFINLPVTDVKVSTAFYEALGFILNPQFSDESGSCLVINETTFAMVLSHEKFRGFSDAPVPDAKASTGLMVALAFEDREAVDRFSAAALANGGSEPRPVADLGFMYQRTISDPDGHRWEPFFMDMTQAPQG
jgi:predicted lactoylglutathione lyase